jgi:hypothetical protein
MEREPERSDTSRSEAIEARASLALWLRTGRAQRGMSLDDVARVTKIQPRILERLEAGKLEGLPADVFIRGFVRSFARCVGLDEAEALRRYASCALSGGIAVGSQDLTPAVRALVDAMSDLVPGRPTAARATPRKMLAVPDEAEAQTATEAAAAPDAPMATQVSSAVPIPVSAQVSAPVPVPVSTQISTAIAIPGAMQDAMPLTAPAATAVAASDAVTGSEAPESASAPDEVIAAELSSATSVVQAYGSKKKRGRRQKRRKKGASPIVGDASASGRWTPTMPSTIPRLGAVLSAWRKPVYATQASAAPCLVIDDADPDSAERILEERAETQAPRRSFLPPILLDREDRSARQGGLTLAVIILLIAATLTLSYLMRRPSASGDGMTQLATPASHAG